MSALPLALLSIWSYWNWDDYFSDMVVELMMDEPRLVASKLGDPWDSYLLGWCT